MTLRNPLREGGGGRSLWSEFQNPSFLVLRRRPCPCRYFTITFVLNFVTVKVSTHLLSFVVISAVFVAVSRPNYLSEFYPSRTSVTHHVPQHSLSRVVAHMQQTAWLSSWIFEMLCTNKRRHMTHCFSPFSKWRACMQANCRSSFACWFGSPASLSRQYSLIWWMLKRRQQFKARYFQLWPSSYCLLLPSLILINWTFFCVFNFNYIFVNIKFCLF